MGGSSPPGPDPALRASQLSQMAQLNDTENTKIKRMLNAAGGLRAFKGSAMNRMMPSDSATSNPNIWTPLAPVGATNSLIPSPPSPSPMHKALFPGG